MSDKHDITTAAFNLVKEMIINNTAEYETQIGPVIDQGAGHNHGTWRVKVEKVDEADDG